MKGWFAMNRAMFTHPIFEAKPDRIAAWAWILATAAWKDTKQDAGGKSIVVKRGQLLTSYRQMSKATGVSLKTLRNLMSRLQDEDAVVIDKGTGRLLITIRNYEKYQSSTEDKGTPKGTGGAQDGHTKEQGNNKQTSSKEEGALLAPMGETVEVSFLSKAVWSSGKPFLASRGVKNPGSIIGKWLKAYSPPEIMTAMEMAQKAGTQDPVPYITQVLSGGINGNGDYKSKYTNGPENRRDPALEQIARLTGVGQASGDGRG